MAAPLEGRIKVALASIMKILDLDLTEFVLQEDPDKSPEENLRLLEKSMDEYSLNLEDLKDNREEVQNAIADWTDLLRKMGQNERPAGDARYAAFEANLHLDEFCGQADDAIHSWKRISDILKHGKKDKTDKSEKNANQQKEGKKDLAKAGEVPTVSCGTVGDQNSQEEKGQQQEMPSTSREQSKPPLNCFFCGEPHWANKCKNYKTVAQREKRLKEVGRCIHCMKNGHVNDNCPRPLKCVKCKEHHPLALCPNWKAPATDDQANNSGRSSPDTSSEPNPKEYVAASTITIHLPLELSPKEILDDGNLYPIISGALINQIDEIMIDASDLQEELGYDVTPPENTEAMAAIESKAPAKKKLKSVVKMMKKNKMGQSCLSGKTIS
jgi:hypothetical protein